MVAGTPEPTCSGPGSLNLAKRAIWLLPAMEPDSVTVYVHSGCPASAPLAFISEFMTTVSEISLDARNRSDKKFDLVYLFFRKHYIFKDRIADNHLHKTQCLILFLSAKRPVIILIKPLKCFCFCDILSFKFKQAPLGFNILGGQIQAF